MNRYMSHFEEYDLSSVAKPTTRITITEASGRVKTDTLYEYGPMYWATWFKDFIQDHFGIKRYDVTIFRENETYTLVAYQPNTYRKIILFKYKFESLL